MVSKVIKCLFIGFIIAAGPLYWKVFYYNPRSDFLQLISGDKHIAVISLEIINADNRIELSDPASAAYFSQVLRQASPHAAELGKTYDVILRLSSGGSVHIWLFLPPDGENAAILCFPDDIGDGDYYGIKLVMPMPEAVSLALRKLR